MNQKFNDLRNGPQTFKRASIAVSFVICIDQIVFHRISDTIGSKNSSQSSGSARTRASRKAEISPKTDTAPTTYNGAFVGVSQGFLAAEIKKLREEEEENSPSSPETKIIKVNVSDRQPLTARGRAERQGYLRKLGFDRKFKRDDLFDHSLTKF